ncbi:MAG: ISL3 family transposase [Chitinophagaceae bacterium]
MIRKQDLYVAKITSGVIGIDDWAFKKGNTYGTIIVDLLQNKVIDFLPDWESETICEWLKEHQEVEIISRDRGGPYSKGAREGAPQAIQVADRFHLLMNLGDATKRMFQSMGKELKVLFTLHNNNERSAEPVSTTEEHRLMEEHTETIPIETINTNIELQLRFNKVKELHSQGYTIRAISRSLDIQRVTIRKYITMDFLSKKKGSRSTNFESYQQFLLHESNRGKLFTELYAAILSEGFNGRYTQFCSNMNELFENHKIIPASRKIDPPVAIRTWSPAKLSIMIQKDTKDLNKEDRKFLKLLCDNSPLIKETEELIGRFKKLFQNKEEGTLKTWVDDVAKSSSGIKGFAKGILSDFQAVNNAVVTPYSNGQVEGQINRLKNIKRRMYGRAGFELLRRMVIFKSG